MALPVIPRMHYKNIKAPEARPPAISVCKKIFFGRLPEVKGAAKTSNSTPKCMWILERGELRSKQNALRSKLFVICDAGQKR